MTSFMVSLYAAVCVALPIIVYQLWAFLAPAFDEKDQKVVSRCVVAATFLFAGGVLFSYFIVLPSATPFLLGFDSDQYDIQLRARDYYSFVGLTSVFTGIVFELPVILLALVRIGVLSADRLAAQPPHRHRHLRRPRRCAARRRPGDDGVPGAAAARALRSDDPARRLLRAPLGGQGRGRGGGRARVERRRRQAPSPSLR